MLWLRSPIAHSVDVMRSLDTHMFHTIPLSPAATSKQLDPSMVLFRAAVPCQTVLGRCLSERQLTTTSAAVFEALESGKIIRSAPSAASLP